MQQLVPCTASTEYARCGRSGEQIGQGQREHPDYAALQWQISSITRARVSLALSSTEKPGNLHNTVTNGAEKREPCGPGVSEEGCRGRAGGQWEEYHPTKLMRDQPTARTIGKSKTAGLERKGGLSTGSDDVKVSALWGFRATLKQSKYGA